MRIVRHFVLAAGGTGGHMIPAHALAAELMERGHRVALITDERGARIPGLFEGAQTHILPAGRLAGGPVGWIRAGRSIPPTSCRGTGESTSRPKATSPFRKGAGEALARSGSTPIRTSC